MNSGVGFRMFMDIALVADKIHVDWNEMENRLKKYGMFEFARKCYGFIEKWFTIHTPLSVDIDRLFFEEATQKIFIDGIFGFDNIDNTGNDVINKIRRKRYHKKEMFKIALKQIFPSGSELKNHKQYSYLNMSVMMLPVAWTHRFYRIIKNKKMDIGIRKIRNIFVTKKQINKRENMMRKWGLL